MLFENCYRKILSEFFLLGKSHSAEKNVKLPANAEIIIYVFP